MGMWGKNGIGGISNNGACASYFTAHAIEAFAVNPRDGRRLPGQLIGMQNNALLKVSIDIHGSSINQSQSLA
jgi:hypothetical protein